MKEYTNKETLEKVYNQFLSLNKTAKYFGISKNIDVFI